MLFDTFMAFGTLVQPAKASFCFGRHLGQSVTNFFHNPVHGYPHF